MFYSIASNSDNLYCKISTFVLRDARLLWDVIYTKLDKC